MKIVCDTNVLISGVLFGGHAREILRLASRGVLSNFLSPDILREVDNVLRRPKFGLHPNHVIEIITLFKDTFESVIPSTHVQAIQSDPEEMVDLSASHPDVVAALLAELKGKMAEADQPYHK